VLTHVPTGSFVGTFETAQDAGDAARQIYALAPAACAVSDLDAAKRAFPPGVGPWLVSLLKSRPTPVASLTPLAQFLAGREAQGAGEGGDLDGSYVTRGIALDVQAKVDASGEGTAVYLTFRSADGCSEHYEWHDHEGQGEVTRAVIQGFLDGIPLVPCAACGQPFLTRAVFGPRPQCFRCIRAAGEAALARQKAEANQGAEGQGEPPDL
jgi:hypothetical protein